MAWRRCNSCTGPDPPQLVVLDWLMPGLNGIELCREIRGRDDERYTYVVLLTAKSSRSDLIGGLDAGADDYLIKPFDHQELQLRLRIGQRIVSLQNQLITTRELFRHQALRDPLTGLWNCVAALDVLEQELARARRQSTAVGVLLADLDHFKQVNDRYGHLVGDAVLREVARTLCNETRPYDTVGRQGGEEFLVVVPESTEASLSTIAERIRAAVERISIPSDSGPVQVTISLGTAIGEANSEQVYSLVSKADAALYQAKHAGRNCVKSAPPALPPREFAAISLLGDHADTTVRQEQVG